GQVLGLATNRNYSTDQSRNGPNTNPEKKGQIGNYPNTVNPLLTGGGDITGYQAGSSFKIFTLTAAIEKGYPLDYSINAVDPYQSKYIVEAEKACPGTRYWCVKNASKSMVGQRNMWSGFGMSVNTFFVPPEEPVDSDNAAEMAKRLGIQFRAHGPDKAHPSDYEFANQADLKRSWGPVTLGV